MISIKVPPLGESIVEATVSRWLKREGDAISAGETLVELETDKVTVEVPALKAGVLVTRAKQEGDVVAVDEILGELDETRVAAAPAAADGQQATETIVEPATPHAVDRADVRASPGARRVAAESGIDLATVAGTGRGGVVSKPDVIEHARQAPAAPPAAPPRAEPALAPRAPTPIATPAVAARPTPSASPNRETREKMSTRRKRIAEHLLEAQHATAHLTTFNEIDMTAVNAVREKYKERVEKEHGVKLSFMPFFVKAACLALEAYPVVNALVDGDSIVYRHYVNMGIAVASDAGLVVPNIKDAHTKSLVQSARDVGELAKRARDGKLTMDDLTGGTFTITNGGVFGSLVSTPIINFPQVGILGLHKVQDRPVAVAGKVEIRPMMYIALSYDHRIIDGQQAVLFLVRVKELMEEPAGMLL
jgi:2-oxoglutarate dehydrogenase E2 component (dihydrolipoamide succinyltransferase)